MSSRRRIYLAATLLVLCATEVIAQNDARPDTEALVTIYSNHITPLGGTLDHQWGAFKGRFFDGEKQLAFIEPAHFVTFRLPAGEHVFTANSWMNKSSTKGVHASMTLEAGRRYFIECDSFAGAPVFGIREVSCQSVQKVGMSLKPLEPVHIRPAGGHLAVSEASFPDCIANTP